VIKLGEFTRDAGTDIFSGLHARRETHDMVLTFKLQVLGFLVRRR
jgi:hypothetical protein